MCGPPTNTGSSIVIPENPNRYALLRVSQENAPMVHCTKCGEQIAENANFCSRCGVRTPKGREAHVPFPAENMREALSQAGREVEKAFQTAGKELEKALRTAEEEIRKAVG